MQPLVGVGLPIVLVDVGGLESRWVLELIDVIGKCLDAIILGVC